MSILSTPLPATHHFGKVAVLLGGESNERSVSLRSGTSVTEALRSVGIDAHAFDPAERPLSRLKTDGFSRAFISLHGGYGENGDIQHALSTLGLPFTGSDARASAQSFSKALSKHCWISHRLQTPAFLLVQPDDAVDNLPIEPFQLPFVVKPTCGGSSIGLTVVYDLSSLPAAITKARQANKSSPEGGDKPQRTGRVDDSWPQSNAPLLSAHPDAVLIEEHIHGREFTVAIIGNPPRAQALPVIEIQVPTGTIYDYHQKYLSGTVRYLCPAPIPNETARMLQDLAISAYQALGCADWGRVDLLLRDDNAPFLLEVNTSPGMTSASLVPTAAKAAGIAYPELCHRILSFTLPT